MLLRSITLGILATAFLYADPKSEDALALALAQAARDKAQLQAQLAAAVKDSADLRRSVDKLTMQGRNESHTAESQATDIRYTQNLNDEEARRAAAEAKDMAEAKARKDAEVAEAAKSDREQQRQQGERTLHASYAAFGAGILAFLTTLVNYVFPPIWKSHIEDRDRKWREIDEANKIRTEEVLAAVHKGAETSTKAIETSNHLTQKIVDMREDLVSAVRATNAALRGKEDTPATRRAGSA